MKLLYVTTHQIPNLIPLFRELNKKDKISFKAVYWQNLSADTYDARFNKVVNFGVDLFSGYDYLCLCNKKRNKTDSGFLFKLKTLLRLIKFIVKEDFDAIAFHGYPFPHVFTSILAKLMKKKTIMRSISTNLDKRSIIKKIIRFLYYSFANIFFDQYWSIHKLNTSFFLAFGAKKEKITLVHHCQGEYKELLKKDSRLLLSHEETCAKYELPNNKKFILFVGVFEERNNLKLLLQSFIDAKLSNDWFLLMVGDGKLKEELKSLVQSENIYNVKFLGFKNQKELISLFANSEILVVPPYSLATHGNVAAEAIQFGCALILSNMVGLHLETVDEEIGLVFDIERKDQLINHLRLLTADINFLNKCKKNALEYGKKKTPAYASNQIVESLEII